MHRGLYMGVPITRDSFQKAIQKRIPDIIKSGGHEEFEKALLDLIRIGCDSAMLLNDRKALGLSADDSFDTTFTQDDIRYEALAAYVQSNVLFVKDKAIKSAFVAQARKEIASAASPLSLSGKATKLFTNLLPAGLGFGQDETANFLKNTFFSGHLDITSDDLKAILVGKEGLFFEEVLTAYSNYFPSRIVHESNVDELKALFDNYTDRDSFYTRVDKFLVGKEFGPTLSKTKFSAEDEQRLQPFLRLAVRKIIKEVLFTAPDESKRTVLQAIANDASPYKSVNLEISHLFSGTINDPTELLKEYYGEMQSAAQKWLDKLDKAVVAILAKRIDLVDDTIKLSALKGALGKSSIDLNDFNMLQGEPADLTDDQLKSIFVKENLKKQLVSAIEARIIQLDTKHETPKSSPEYATTVNFSYIFEKFQDSLQDSKIFVDIKFEGETATVTEGAQKTTIEKIGPSVNDSGSLKVTGPQDAVVKTLVKVYIAELIASGKITRDATGTIAAKDGYTFELRSDVISLHRKEGATITPEEKKTFLSLLNAEFGKQLPAIYKGGLDKEPLAESPEKMIVHINRKGGAPFHPTATPALFSPSHTGVAKPPTGSTPSGGVFSP